MQIRSIMSALGVIGAIAAAPASAGGDLIKFDRGIGVDPVAGLAGAVPVLNVVKGINPGGRIWVIEKLKATVRENGAISVKGEGLVLGATDAIGTPGGILQVAASLFCGADRFDSQAVPIDRHGDFKIGGSLNSAPTNPCTAPVLLIRNATGGVLGVWFAAGIPGDDAD